MTFHWRRSKARLPVGPPLFDDAVMLLEERIMLDAVPVVSVSAPDHVLLSNPANNFQVTLTFDNTGSQAGYGPYVEVVVPHNGADGVAHGPANADGATFVGATYLGQPVGVAANLTFDAAGHATNPLSGDVVTGAPGDGLVVLQLPFGSFTGPQTPAALIATFTQSSFGNVGVPLTIAARGGFQFGLDPLDNPGTDPHLVGPTNGASYTPTLAVLTKTSDAPANTSEETATGPNNDHSYTINLDVAAGQTLTAATLSDALPDSIVYLGATVVGGGGTITHQPVIGSVVDPADNLLTVGFASLTGTTSTTDAVVKVHFYVNDTHFDGTPVVGPVTGSNATTVNTAHLDSTFTPLDPIDPVIAFTLDATHADTIHDKPVAIQKSSAIVIDTGPAGLNSGDTVEYTLTVQVSDYFSLGNVSLTDVLADGQRLDTSFTPTIAVTQRGVTSATGALAGVIVGPAAPGDVTTGNEFAGTFASTFDKVSGTTTSTVDISHALILGGIDADGVLAGGRTQAGDAAAHTGGTTVTVKFRAVVQNNFESDALPAANRAVHQGDTIGNAVTIAASIRDNALPATVLDPAATRDDGAASQTIARGGVGKTIYAINGDTNLTHYTAGGNVQLVAGDTITYRLKYDLPVTSYQALSLTDFLPLPVLAAQTLAFNAGAPLDAGNFAYGPTDTLHLAAGAPTPTETFDAAGNSVRFAYTDYSIQNSGVASKASTIDLLFTVAVQDSMLADGLFLTNLATSSESNTPGNATSGNSIVRFALGQPKLLVQKAIVSATSGTITTPESVAAVTFLAPGVTAGGLGYTQTAPLTDAALGANGTAAASKLNSNVTGLDAGDDARVAIVVNNQGTSAKGAFNAVLNDALAPGTSFRGGSLASANLIVARGDGLIFTAGTDYTATQTPAGLSIHFLDGAAARIEKNGAADRGDIVLVTYDIHLDNNVVISPTALTSSATISAYTAVPGGLNQVVVPPTDAATIGLLQPTVVKTLVSTTDPSTTGANLTIGENATYEVTYTFAEGTTPLVRLVDLLPRTTTAGIYQFVSASIVSVGGNLKQADGTTAVDAAYFGPVAFGNPTNFAQAAFGGAGKTVIDTADNTVTAADTIVVDYVVRATTAATNVNGLTGVNTGQFTYGPTNTRLTGTAPIGISLPDLTVAKAFVPNGNPTPDANDPVTFTITVANPGAVTGYAIALSDPFPSGLNSLTVTGVTGAGLTPADFSTAGNALTLLNHINLAGGQSFTVTVAATLGGNVHPGGTLTNTANLTFDTEGGVPPGVARTVTKASSALIPLAPDTIAKSILTTSVGGDASSTVDVGEIVTFRLVTSLAEGSSDALTISDALPAGLVYVDAQIVSVGANIAGATLNPAVTTPGGVPTFAFGNVTDAADNLPQNAADQIVINVRARVGNVAGNVSGTVLTDIASASTFVDGATKALTSSLPVTVAVPDLIVTKALTSPAKPDASDTTTFTINVHHAADSTAIAYDLGLLDTLPAGLTNLHVTAVNNDPEGDGANGLALTTASFTTVGNSLALAAPLDLALNQSFTVTIAATVADTTIVGSTLTNTAAVTYSTLPGTDPTERTVTHSGSAALTTAASQTFTKVITATDDPLTGTAQFRPGVTDLTIGETATVVLTTTLQQGTTPGVVIVDHLPTNAVPGVNGATFGFVGAPVLTLGGGITFTGSGVGVLSDTNGDGIADTVTYTLGSVTVPGTSGNGTGAVTISYQTTPLDRPENAAGDMLASPAMLTSALGTLAANVDYDLVAPAITLTKAVTTNFTPAGEFADYTITVTNSGTGPAGNLAVTDLLPPGVVELGPPLIAVDGGPAAPGAFNVLPPLAAGSHLTISFLAGVTPAAVGQTVQTNTATATFDSHDGPGGRPGMATGSVGFIAPGVQLLTKTITGTSDPLTGTTQYRPGITDLNIGENAQVSLVASLHQGTTTNVVITDHLPVGTGPAATSATFIFDSAVTIALPAGTTITGTLTPVFSDTDGDGIADAVTFTLGTVVIPAAGSTPGIVGDATAPVTITYATRALDLPGNAAGDALSSPATLVSNLGTKAASVNYDLVAPLLTATKMVTIAAGTPNGTPDAGDTVSYLVTLTNTGSGPAEAITLADPGPAGVTLGSATITVGGVSTVVPINGSVVVPSLTAGASATIAYTGVVTDAAVAGSTQTNTATATYTSSPTNGHAGTVATSATFATAASQLFTKAITATDDPLTGKAQFRAGIDDLAIGETATVVLTATLEQGTTPGVVIVDHLPTDAVPGATGATFGFVGVPVLSVGAGITFTGSGIGVLSDTDGDGIADTVTYTLGAVTVPGIAGAGTGALTITYDTTPLDRPENVAGDLLASPATLTSALGTLAANVDYDLVAPNLVVTKAVQVNPGGADAGDLVVYTIHLANLGTGPAADIVLTDTLPPGLVVVAGGAVSVNGGGYQFQPIPTLAPGDTADVFYTVQVRDSAVTGSVQTNVANVAYDSHAGFGGRPGTTSASASFTTLASQTLTKTIVATDDPLTGTAQFRPGVDDLAIGETATIQVVATLQQGTTTGVTIVDHLPVNTTPGATGATFGFGSVDFLTLPTGATITGSVAPILTDTDGDGILDTVTYSLGNVTIPGSLGGQSGPGTAALTFTYRTTPLDRPENAAGDMLASPVTLTSGLGTVAANVDYDLVAPALEISKGIVGPPKPRDAGDQLGYFITITNVGSGPAADLQFADLLPAGLEQLGPPIVHIDGGPPQYFYSFPDPLAPDATITVELLARVTDAAVTGSRLANTATIAFDSHAGPGGRAGSASDTASFTTLASQALTKTITATDDPLTGSSQFRPDVVDLGIGETATVALTTTLQQGTTLGVVIVDHLPVNTAPGTNGATFAFVGAPVLTASPGITFTGSPLALLTDTDGDGVLDTVTYSLGAVTVHGTPGTGTGALTITYATTPLDRPENVAGDLLASPATLTSALGTIARSVDYDLVAPNLVVAKSIVTPAASLDAGDQLTYRVTLTNAGSGPAADIVLADLLPAGLRQVGAATVSVDGGPAATGAIPALAAGSHADVTIVAQVTDAATTGAALTNTAVATYDSHAGFGGRPGSGSASATFTTLASQALTKTITGTSDPLTGTDQYRPGIDDLNIGETAQVRVAATFQQGTTANVVLVDHLPVDAGPAGTGGTFEFATAPTLILPAGATITGSFVPVLSDTNGDGIADTVTFTLGSVTIPGMPGNGTGEIAFTYATRALDRPENAAGDALASPVTMTSALGTVAANVDYDLVAPNLVVTKTVATAEIPDAGDAVRYVVTLTNTGSGPAEGIVVTDPGPPGVTLGTATVTAGGATSTGGPGSLAVPSLAAGASATITYAGTVTDAALAGGPQVNTATATYTSSPTGGHAATTSASATFTTAASQSFTKVITATDDPLTGTAQFRPGVTDLAIGETATIVLTTTLQQGTTPGVVIVDHLPTNATPGSTGATFGFVGAPVLTLGSGITLTGSGVGVLSDTDGDGIADTVTYTLGAVTVPGAPGAGVGAVTISYQTTPLDRPENAAGDALASPATLTSALGSLAATVDVDLVTPNVTVTKAVATTGTPDAGDTVMYTVSLTNTGSGPAGDVTLADLAAPGITGVGPATLTVGGVSTVFAGPNAVTLATLDAGQTATVTYTAVVADSAVAGAAETNTATASFDSHAGPGGRPGTASGSATFTTAASQTFTKVITATDDPLTGTAQFRPGVVDLAIGEAATVQLTTTLQQGTTAGVVIVDHLPTNAVPGGNGATFGFVGAPVLSVAPGITFTGSGTGVLSDTDGDGIADTVTYTLGSVTVPGTPGNGTGAVTISYQTTPLDRPENAAGDLLASPAMLTSGLGSLAASVGFDLVAPTIVVTKAVATAGTPDAGDTVTYTVTLTNTGSGPAGNLTLADLAAPGITGVGPATLTVGGVSTVFAGPNAVTLATLDAGQTATVTYTAVVADSAVAGAAETNTATASFDSHAGPGGRPGTASGSATFTTAASQVLTKTIVATSEPFTGTGQFRPGVTDLTTGEVATFELRATFSEGTTTGVVLTDTLAGPGGTLTLTGTPVIVFADGSTAPFTGTVTQVDTNGDGIPDQVRFAVGTVTIPGDNNAANNSFTIRYQAAVADRPENAAGDLLTLPATLTSSLGSATAAAGVDLVAPALVVGKVLAAVQPTDGLSAVFILTVGHASNSSAAATGVVLTDVVPAGSLVAGTTIVSGPAGATVAGGTVTVPLLALGDTLVVRVTITPDFAHPVTGTTVNRATADYATTTGGGGHHAQGAASAPIPVPSIVSSIRFRDDLYHPVEEHRYVSPLLPIEPVYSGSAAPGSYVEIVVTDEFGSASSEGGALTDAGGNWLIRAPSASVDRLLHDATVDDYYASTRLFAAPAGDLFAARDLFGSARVGGRVDVGSVPAFGTQIVHVNVTPNITGGAPGFTASYAPTWRDQLFVETPGLSTERAFADAAGKSVARLYDELAAPEAAGLNRFNRAFLSAADL